MQTNGRLLSSMTSFAGGAGHRANSKRKGSQSMEQDQWRELKSRLVDYANANKELMDGTTEPLKRILNENDLVFGVWMNVREPDGVGTTIIKGLNRLEAIAASGKPAPAGTVAFQPPPDLRISAISCPSADHAEACRITLGDGE